MIKYFAVCTEFAIARIARIVLRVVILFLRVRIFVLFTLLFLVLIVAVVGVLLRYIALLLLALLWPESCDVLLSDIVAGVILFVDDVDHVPLLFVAFDPVIGEESVVGIVDRHPRLILVRKQLSHIFRSGCPENLSEEEFIVSPDTVIGVGREHVLSVGTLWLNGRRTFWFNPV